MPQVVKKLADVIASKPMIKSKNAFKLHLLNHAAGKNILSWGCWRGQRHLYGHRWWPWNVRIKVGICLSYTCHFKSRTRPICIAGYPEIIVINEVDMWPPSWKVCFKPKCQSRYARLYYVKSDEKFANFLNFGRHVKSQKRLLKYSSQTILHSVKKRRKITINLNICPDQYNFYHKNHEVLAIGIVKDGPMARLFF